MYIPLLLRNESLRKEHHFLASACNLNSYTEPPITEAEYQLSFYKYKLDNGEDPSTLHDLIYFTILYYQDPLNNPLKGTLTLPKEMRD